MITYNTYKINIARMAALSGIEHFKRLNIINPQELQGLIIPETQLSPRTSYSVEVFQLGSKRLAVTSKGNYTKNNRILFFYPIRAIFEF
jgi:hypothetical protein